MSTTERQTADEVVIDLRDEASPTIDITGRWTTDDEKEIEVGVIAPSLLSGPILLRHRCLDIAAATFGLVIAMPIFGTVALLNLVSPHGSVFYRQERLGRGGEPFGCLKFRSMHADADRRLEHLLATDEVFRTEWERGQKVKNDPRITRVGRILRRTSLDEMPQLVNVLRGEMSMVGPRPIVPEEAVRYGEAMSTVLSVKPGITGLWQVSGRNDLPYHERVALDVHYARHKSLRLDVVILARTAGCVLTGRGAN